MITSNRVFRALDAESIAGSAGGSALGALNPIGLALGGAQTAFGIVQKLSADAKLKKLLSRRKAFTTPDEVFKMLNATESRASQGYDPATLQYLTNELDRASGSAVGVAARMGADPNVISAIFDQKVQGLMKIGAENHVLNTENWSRYLGALGIVGENKTAEWKSQQDIIKDQIQATVGNKEAADKNISGGINNVLSTLSAGKISSLYKQYGSGAVDPVSGISNRAVSEIPLPSSTVPPSSTAAIKNSEYINPYSTPLVFYTALWNY